MHTSVIIKTIIPGTHAWPDAPDEVRMLRHPHFHDFHIKVSIREDHDFEKDCREHEFFLVRAAINLYFRTHYEWDPVQGINFGSRSCEMIAMELLEYMSGMHHVEWVECFEDDRDGARVTR
jgi:hypothetical protein